MKTLKPSLSDKDKKEMSWDDILAQPQQQLRKPTTLDTTPKRRTPPSVKKVCDEVDNAIRDGEFLTEERFHSMDTKTERQHPSGYFQKTLESFSQWASLCQADT